MAFFEQHHDDYRTLVRDFVEQEVTPRYAGWEAAGLIDRAVWTDAAQRGLTGLGIGPEHGGLGIDDWRFRMVVAEELGTAGAAALNVALVAQDDLVIPLLLALGTDDQLRRWLPAMAEGRSIGAVALTEPGAGSDLRALRTTAVRDGDDWLLTGQKAFVSNGGQADRIIVAAVTGPDAGATGPGASGATGSDSGDPGTHADGLTLFVLGPDTPGLDRGRRLDKLGLHAQDTIELFLTGARVPDSDRLGEVGTGHSAVMAHLPRQRLALAVCAWAGARGASTWAQDYVAERRAFGRPVADFQHTRFVLAEVETELDVTRAYLEQCATALTEHTLTAAQAAKAKWWATERAARATSRLLQLFGGYGLMAEYPISRAYRDLRMHTIVGGSTEVLKDLVGKNIVGRRR